MVKRREVTAPAPTTSARRRAVVVQEDGPNKHLNYFAQGNRKQGLEFVSSGCCLLDEVLGGGYVLGRVANLVGDKSSGKTLLAIEASANFANTYRDGFIRYVEAEAAFDEDYASALGMPVHRVDFGTDIFTVEELFDDLSQTLADRKDQPGLYVIDSLDALSDKAETERKIDDGSYGAAKAKKMSEMFRRLVKNIEKSRMLLLVISQIRDKIGVTFGETKMRAGGKALDFYASQVLWLAQIEQMKRTVEKIDRVIGVKVKANCKKNKIGLPFRQGEFPILFGYGIDDLTAATEWLLEIKQDDKLKELGLSSAGYKVRIANVRNKGGHEARELRAGLSDLVRREWARIETSFLPQAGKY